MLGTVAGVVVAGGTVAEVEAVGHMLLGLPGDPAQASLPLLGMVLLAWSLGALAGALTGAIVGRWKEAAYVAAVFGVVGILINAAIIRSAVMAEPRGGGLRLGGGALRRRFAASLEPGGPSARSIVA